jgi:HEAT repeat protein
MTHEDEYRRWEAVFSMRNVPGEGVVDVIVAHMDHETEPDIRVRQESALALGELGDASTVGPLVEALGSDPSPQVRWRAALSLKRLGYASILEDLREALDSEEDSQVVEQITETIESLEGGG